MDAQEELLKATDVEVHLDSCSSYVSDDLESLLSENEKEEEGNMAKTMIDEEDDGDEEEGMGVTSGPIRSKNEVNLNDVPWEPIEFTLSDMAIIHEIGCIHSIVESMLIIESYSDKDILDVGSVLCMENKIIVGRVFETFGPVKKPFYSVRFPTQQDIDKDKYILKSPIYYVPDQSQFLYVQEFKNMKGSDASNLYDEEIPEEEQEFSDDEKEIEYKKRRTFAKKRRNKMKYELSPSNRNPIPIPIPTHPSSISLSTEYYGEAYEPLQRPHPVMTYSYPSPPPSSLFIPSYYTSVVQMNNMYYSSHPLPSKNNTSLPSPPPPKPTP